MKRIVHQRLTEWKYESPRKPLILRGARQVGKTHAVRQIGATFTHFVEVNFEFSEEICQVFEGNLDPERICREISLVMKVPIIPGKTLLFFDEIQACPKAILALRYFYEKMPQLHVIAAGSLLEFANELIGMPVGRIESCYVYPLSFIEYLVADGETLLVEAILSQASFSEVIHNKLLKHLGIYLALGGMPEVLKLWIETKDPLRCSAIHSALLDTYRQDFQKYAKKSQLKYLSLLFENIPRQLGQKFKFSKVGEYRKRELDPSLDLLLTANIVKKIVHTAAQGIPIGADANPERFKLLFIDVGLTQSLLDLDLSSWFVHPEKELTNKGSLVESFVGQELLAYANPTKKTGLYYWQRESRGSAAEIDYVIQQKGTIVPIEVKSGKSGKLRSLHTFLETHPHSPSGIKVSVHPHRESGEIKSIPLYALSTLAENQERLTSLLT